MIVIVDMPQAWIAHASHAYETCVLLLNYKGVDRAGFAPTKPKRQNLSLVGLSTPPTILYTIIVRRLASGEDQTPDLRLTKSALYHWATKASTPIGFDPMTSELTAPRSPNWAKGSLHL